MAQVEDRLRGELSLNKIAVSTGTKRTHWQRFLYFLFMDS